MRTIIDTKTLFDAEGYVSGIEVCNLEQVLHYRQQFDRLEQSVGREKCVTGLVDWHFQEEFIWKLATNSRLLNVIRDILGPDVLLMATHFFCKYGPQEKYVAWHQDLTYWGLEPPKAVTAWYAIDDSDQENGCMRVIPGSQLQGILEHAKSRTAGNLLSVNQEVAVSDDEESRAVDLVLQAGQISVHDGQIIHGSLPNRSTRRRCGLANCFISPSVRQVDANSQGLNWRPVLVSGTDHYGHFTLVAPPFSS